MTFLKVFLFAKIVSALCSFISPSFEWYKFEDTSCSVLFPKAPKHDTLFQEIGDEKVAFYIHSLKTGPFLKDSNYGYELLYNSASSKTLMSANRGTAEAYFQGTVSSMIEDLKGKVLSARDITLNSYYGRDVTISFANDTKVARLKCFVPKGIGYTLEVYSPAGYQPNTNATTFFESFKIK